MSRIRKDWKIANAVVKQSCQIANIPRHVHIFAGRKPSRQEKMIRSCRLYTRSTEAVNWTKCSAEYPNRDYLMLIRAVMRAKSVLRIYPLDYRAAYYIYACITSGRDFWLWPSCSLSQRRRFEILECLVHYWSCQRMPHYYISELDGRMNCVYYVYFLLDSFMSGQNFKGIKLLD